jgi:predicted acylesterase/phospholipase RssA
MIKTLILSGGGVRGIAMIGAMSALRDRGLLQQVVRVVGVSVGSIVATYFAMSIPERETIETIMDLDAATFRRSSVLNFVNKYGLDTGWRFVDWIKRQFDRYGFSPGITFVQLFRITGKALHIGATNVDTGKMHYFSHLTDPDCSVVSAIRMSCGLPFVLTLWKYMGHGYIDGAVIDNFPVREFAHHMTKTEQALGILLSDEKHSAATTDTFFDYVDRIGCILVDNSNERALQNIPKNCYVLELIVKKASIVQIHESVKRKLYDVGVATALGYIDELGLSSDNVE